MRSTTDEEIPCSVKRNRNQESLILVISKLLSVNKLSWLKNGMAYSWLP